MTLLLMIFRKMYKNKGLVLCLLVGLILTVAMVSSIPIYKDGILNRMLIHDFQNTQKQYKRYPGTVWVSTTLDQGKKGNQKLIQQTDQLWETMKTRFGIPALQDVEERQTGILFFDPHNPKLVNNRFKRYMKITAVKGMDSNVQLIDGRMPSPTEKNGVVEALITAPTLSNEHILLNQQFDVKDNKGNVVMKVLPVGIVQAKDTQNLFWYNGNMNDLSNTFIINYNLFNQKILPSTDSTLSVNTCTWYLALDYNKMSLKTIQNFITSYHTINAYLHNHFSGSYVTNVPALYSLGIYLSKNQQLRTLLLSLNVPVIIMLGFYLMMVSNLMMGKQENEIAVLRSRGASKLQMLFSYVIENCTLGLIALLVGPPLGLYITRMLGATKGFLQMQGRTQLAVHLSSVTYKYALVAVLVSVVMTIIPAFRATKVSIVQRKRQSSRLTRMSFWHKTFIDVIFIGISIYELHNFRQRLKDLAGLGVGSGTVNIDPILFLVPTLFMIGFGLFLLRIYPLCIRFIYWVGKKWWPPSLYSTLIQVGRTATQYQVLMVFIIITLSTGAFSASAARTINQNTVDRIKYQNGADIILSNRWQSNEPPPSMGGSSSGSSSGGGGAATASDSSNSGYTNSGMPTLYNEPPFLPFTKLPGVQSETKVFTRDDAKFKVSNGEGIANLMGIVTDSFGKTAWFRNGLLPHSFYEYLNLIAKTPNAVLISRGLANKFGLHPGDEIDVGWPKVTGKPFVVYGIADYFPTFNPNPTKDNPNPYLIVANLSTVQADLNLEPYQIWLKMKPGASHQTLYKALQQKNLHITSLTDTQQQIDLAKNDPFLIAINGIMTLGFLISVIISFCGFLIYWMLSLGSRTLQLGILRAMGISFSQLIGMLTVEQILTSGAGILIGIGTGQLASRLFVPLFQIAFNPNTQVPPFQVIFSAADQARLYIIVISMIVIALLLLGYMLSRIKIHQAVKLGED